MLPELKFSEARSKLTEVVDRAQRFEIPVIKPRKKSEDFTILLRGEMLKALLDQQRCSDLTVNTFHEDDGSITISVDPFDIAVNGATLEEAANRAAEDVIEYACEYMDPDNFALYYRSQNRHSHLALVVKTLLCDSKEQVKVLLGLA